ncbi:amidohydrolase [Acidipila sp. EB88]|uniref:amidohydrolase n=1 Tax=Acidipila sp. EB88 TaxID=2305226 RepID=UPI000F5E8543|nr:amidohydrolase [Acidipila sp. EB88]RRA49518.1 amidohydrolase [Acidipila sp. EB88]
MTPSLLFHNGRILTGESLLTASPRIVSALLVRDGLVAATGHADDLRALATPGTLEIDLHHAFCMPGFNDAHLHLGEGARQRREVDLAGAASLDEALARIARAAAIAPAGAWLTGGGWDEHLWLGATLPTRHDLDRVTRGHPAVFARIDVHLAVANSAALRLGNVDRHTIAPTGSTIDHDPSGEPTGILRERPARALVEQHMPAPTAGARADALRAVLAEALRWGVTSVQDNSTDEDFAALCALHAAGELPVRISEWLPFDAPLADLQLRRDRAPQDRFLRTTMLKAFLDGSLGSRTAAMLEPYADAPGVTGLPFYTAQRLEALALERAAAGFQLGFHAIGDHALALALDAFEAVRAQHHAAPGAFPPITARSRVEHAQTASPSDFQRTSAAGAIASMQPNHLLSDLRWVGARLGPGRSARAYAWRSFLDAGAVLAFGTDFPVEPLNPFRGLYATLTRRPEQGGDAFHPEQCLTIAEALYAATQGSAYAEGSESWKGMLVPGHVADFVVLDRDPLTATPLEILHTEVVRTVIGGQTRYQRPDPAEPRC